MLKDLLSEVKTYKTTLPFSKKKVEYRPFRVKEEKILLMAMEEGTDDAILAAVRNLIKECLITNINVGDLPLIDIEFVFLQIRAKSVGEVVKPKVNCPYTGKQTYAEINLTEVKPKVDSELTRRIEITDQIGISVRHPSINILIETDLSEKVDASLVTESIKLIASCITEIYTPDEVIQTETVPKEEVIDFVEALSPQNFGDLSGFFETTPKLEHEVKYVVLVEDEDGKTKKEEHSIVLSGLSDFFL